MHDLFFNKKIALLYMLYRTAKEQIF